MKKYFSTIIASLLLCSCVDTVIIPEDRTVDEDFWKTEADVESMVMGAYQSMLGGDVMLRLAIWGDFRSDELVRCNINTTNSVTDDLSEIESANMETDNQFSEWGSLYAVINNCNIVLDHADRVLGEDPEFTQGTYDSYCSQMLALRSLCYFYLVRNFRDVPYSRTAIMDSSQDMNLPQLSPDSVLQNCINDLLTAEKNAINPTTYSGEWLRVGIFTRDGIRALLADIYLWRAAVKHSAADYQRCVDYCDLVIKEKSENRQTSGRGGADTREYPLAVYSGVSDPFERIFVDGNAEESILELQMNGENNSNTGICQAYHRYRDNTGAMPYFKASNIFGNRYTYTQTSDHRQLENVYGAGLSTDDEDYFVRKMVAQEGLGNVNPVGATGPARNNERAYTKYAQNYIVYRLSDVMLMKAEALVELAAGDDDELLEDAFKLVQYVNARSLYAQGEQFTWASTYQNKAVMEELVMQERLRELCFEGKRWYDLMRYNYRHIDNAADYSRTLADINDEAGGNYDFANNYADMLDLMVRKLSSGQAAVKAKMATEPKLYMPIPRSQTEVNPNTRQNPAYSDNDRSTKNI